MKRIAILIGFTGLASAANAQLVAGSSGLIIKAGTSFYSQGLVLTPDTDMTLQNDTISLSGTALPVGSGASIARVYTIAPGLTFSGTVGIRYTAPELNGNLENTLSVVNAGPNAGFFSLPSTASSGGNYYVFSPALSNMVLNRVTATSAGLPLPIRYHSFAATAAPACSIKLSWYADQAQPVNFQLEHSPDGKIFRALPVAVTQSGDLFSCTDPSPLPGRNMYRLVISETGEPVAYSTVATLNNPCTIPSQTKVYPNPASVSLTVTLDDLPDGSATMDLLDITGKVMKTFRVVDRVSSLDLQGIAAGSYFLKVQNGSLRETIKIVKL
jgi:hypothetical protein